MLQQMGATKGIQDLGPRTEDDRNNYLRRMKVGSSMGRALCGHRQQPPGLLLALRLPRE